MKNYFIFLMSNLLVVTSVYAKMIKYDFENVKIGSIPKDWIISATHPKKPLALWEVIKDDNAPSGKKVLALTKPNDSFFNGSIFNLCYTKKINFKNGEISVKFKARSGHTDKGGGIMWRVQDANNYYVVRFNPLEDNFCYYVVKNGNRHLLTYADIKLGKGWHSMKIIQNEDYFTGYLDRKKILSFKNSIIKQPGGIGLWTKSDAATSFDDLRIITK